MRYIQEQIDIIKSNESHILVEALAGTGKTTTLIGYAEENFESSILYLVFSKDMRKIVKNKFPSNCEVHTINSFALKFSKELMSDKILKNNFNTSDIIELLPSLSSRFSNNRTSVIVEATNILKAYSNLMNSNISLKDFKPENYYETLAFELYNNVILNGRYIDHSALLKYFSENNLFDFNFDIVMIDEVQDINPIMFSIIERIKPKKVLMVGDLQQSIYGFRQNINVFRLPELDSYTKYSLTKSFRFGEAIANSVNTISSIIYGKSINIKYNENLESKIIESKVMGPCSAYITRTNAHLFDIAIEYALEGLNIAMPFNWEELKLLMEDIIYLKMNIRSKIKNKIISKYKSFAELEALNKNGSDLELRYLIKVVLKYDILILDYLKLLESKLSSPKYADITLLTAHKSKGLEFLYVQLGTDFKDISKPMDIEEANLIYVSMTRAIKELNINSFKLSRF